MTAIRMEQSLKAGPLVSVHFTVAPSQMSRDRSCSVLHNLPAAGISVPSALSAIILWLPSTLKFSHSFLFNLIVMRSTRYFHNTNFFLLFFMVSNSTFVIFPFFKAPFYIVNIHDTFYIFRKHLNSTALDSGLVVPSLPPVPHCAPATEHAAATVA